jgi:pimeloyl-ACP methyl ester carboxylesterase
VAYINALTWQMIYEQPVLYEFKNLGMPVLIIVGQKDGTILGKNLINKKKQSLHGNIPALARKAAATMKNGRIVIIPGVGHIPHIQTPDIFSADVVNFLK